MEFKENYDLYKQVYGSKVNTKNNKMKINFLSAIQNDTKNLIEELYGGFKPKQQED